MACGDAAAAAAAVREGGQGAASMELAAAIAVDVCVLEGSLEVEGWLRDGAKRRGRPKKDQQREGRAKHGSQRDELGDVCQGKG